MRWTALLIFSLVAGCDADGPSQDPRTPNVLIVVLDALRADKIGCYGLERDVSPVIDGYAADPNSVLFARHYVQGAYTKPSTASLFTGLYVFQHGVIEGHQAKSNRHWREARTQVLDGSHRTMAERLSELGFHTFGVVKSRHLVPDYGFDQGFDTYISPEDDVDNDDERVERTLQLIDEADGPFFGYLHLSAVHFPWDDDERDPAYMEQHGFAYDEAARQRAGVDFTSSDVMHAIMEGNLTLDEADVRFLNLIYEASLRQVDGEVVARLLRELRRRGVLDSTLVILTADHGEELYDHQGFGHGHHVWDEIVHVPMIVRFPPGRRPPALPSRVTDVTSAIDVLPAILSWVGAEDPQDLPGVPIFQGRTSGFAYSEAKRAWCLVREGFKLVAGKREKHLFDLRTEPGEQQDLAATNPERVAAMEVFAEVLRNGAKGQRTDAREIDVTLEPDAIEELRELGYIK